MYLMKMNTNELKQIIEEECKNVINEIDNGTIFEKIGLPPELRASFKDTFKKVPDPTTDVKSRANKKERQAWSGVGGKLSIYDKKNITKFIEDAGLSISPEKYMDNIEYAHKNDRLGDKIYSLVDALALANMTGTRRGHRKFAKGDKAPPKFTMPESQTSIEEIIKEEIENVMSEMSEMAISMDQIKQATSAAGATDQKTQQMRAANTFAKRLNDARKAMNVLGGMLVSGEREPNLKNREGVSLYDVRNPLAFQLYKLLYTEGLKMLPEDIRMANEMNVNSNLYGLMSSTGRQPEFPRHGGGTAKFRDAIKELRRNLMLLLDLASKLGDTPALGHDKPYVGSEAVGALEEMLKKSLSGGAATPRDYAEALEFQRV